MCGIVDREQDSPTQLAENHVNQSLPALRVGLGYDSHRLGNGGPLRIGGVDVPAEVHTIGHSDADVLLHAITDALLGAVAEPDIGQLFPNNDPDNRDRDSREFVHEAIHRVRHHGMDIVNLDGVILAERPKMGPHINDIRQSIASMLDIETNCVGLKAKTGEGIGTIGNAQAIAARVVVLLHRI